MTGPGSADTEALVADRPEQVRQPSPNRIERARAGDSDAFGELWREFQPIVLRYLLAKRVRAPHDVASQVWIDVAGSIGRFAGGEDEFRRWLFTIAHRRSVDEVRRAVRRPELVGEVPEQRTPSTEDAYERTTSLARALDVVAQLPPNMAEAVMLRVVFDLSITDVAEVMNMAEGNVRVLVHRGLKQLAAVTKRNPETMETLT